MTTILRVPEVYATIVDALAVIDSPTTDQYIVDIGPGLYEERIDIFRTTSQANNIIFRGRPGEKRPLVGAVSLPIFSTNFTAHYTEIRNLAIFGTHCVNFNGSDDCIVDNCVIADAVPGNPSAPVLLNGDRNIVRNCFSCGGNKTAAFVRVQSGVGNRIEGNRLANGSYPATATNYAMIWVDSGSGTQIIRNMMEGVIAVSSGVFIRIDPGAETGILLDENIYLKGPGSDNLVDFAGTVYNTVSGLQTGEGQELNSSEFGNTLLPLLAGSPAGSSIMLQAGPGVLIAD